MPATPAPPGAPIADRPSGAAVMPHPDVAEPGRYHVTERVPILPAHEDTITLTDPKTGRMLRDEQGRPRRRRIKIDGPALERMADRANQRSAKGHVHAIHIGHVRLYEEDEEKQPEVIGFMRNFGVGPITDGRGNVLDPTPHLYADECIDRHRQDHAASFPHRSPEFDPDFADPGNSEIDSLALLRRHPKYPMGLLRYQRDPADVAGEGPPPGETEAPEPGEEPVPDPMTDKPLTLADLMAAIPDIIQAVVAAMPGDEAPADDTAPVQAAEAMPSGDNTFAPALAKEKPDEVQHCDDDMKMQYAKLAPDVAAIRKELDRVKAENASLTARLEDNEEYVGNIVVQNCRDTIGKNLDELASAGVVFDRAAEEEELLSLAGDPDRMSRHLGRMKLQYARTPRNNRFADVAAPAVKGGRAIKDEVERDRIVALALKHKVDFSDAKDGYFAGTLK